jgi:hypothetical protein
MQKTLIIDAHVHIYPNFDLVQALRHSLKNSAAFGYDNAINIWMLTERSDCTFFNQIDSISINGFQFEQTSETVVTVRNNANEKVLHIFAGRQIVSSDNLEVCALATTFTQPDKKLNTMDTIQAVRNSGGVAAINWAPGKWFGGRGQIVQHVFQTIQPSDLFISDTTMRPSVWTTPKMMAAAQKQGFRVLRGSDPLPFHGEEKYISSYATIVSGDFDSGNPDASLRAVLTDPSIELSVRGRRSGLLTFMQRQKKIMTEKKN